jgi:hypothetical protein
MSRLDAANLLSTVLPAGAEAAVASLARLDALVQEKKAHGPSPVLELEARALYAELPAQLAALRHGDVAPSLGSPAELRERFLESVLLWLRFCQSSSAEPLIDTIGTRSLAAFPLDLPPDAAAFRTLRAALAVSQRASEAELARAEQRVARSCSTLTLKSTITAAIAARASAAADSAADRLLLLQQCYGELPFRASDVDLVLTSTAVFFVLPLGEARLEVPDWEARPEPERVALQAFLAQLARANLAETRRFPAFGLFDAAQLSGVLVSGLSAATGANPALIGKTLPTMVNILNRSEIDQYLVHDAWGHTWQEVLSEFELEYALLPHISAPLRPAGGIRFAGASATPLARAFHAQDGQTQLDEAALLGYAEVDLRARIQIGLSQVLSELLADFVEAKYSRLNAQQPLPTSSLLRSDNLKLDLTWQDLSRQARRWSKPYRMFWSKPEEQARWVSELAASGLPERGLAEAVAQAARALETTFADVLRPIIAPPELPAAPTTVATRCLLELALLCGELERVLDETAALRASPAWSRPTYCPDLWAVALSHLYEADRQRRFWGLDTLVRELLRGACDALGSTLALESDGAGAGQM